MKERVLNTSDSIVLMSIISYAINMHESLDEIDNQYLEESTVMIKEMLANKIDVFAEMVSCIESQEPFKMDRDSMNFINVLFFQDLTRFLKKAEFSKKEIIGLLDSFYE